MVKSLLFSIAKTPPSVIKIGPEILQPFGWVVTKSAQRNFKSRLVAV